MRYIQVILPPRPAAARRRRLENRRSDLLRRTNRARSLTIPFDFYHLVDNSTSVRNSFHTKEIQVMENKIFLTW